MRYERVLALLVRPAPLPGLYIVALAFGLSLPSLVIGLQGDDYDLLKQVAQDRWGAFAFTPAETQRAQTESLQRRQQGLAPWWQDDAYRQRFLRPLASLTHWFDSRVLGAPPWSMHLENALLYAILVWIAGFAYRSVGLGSPAWALACLFFACNAGPATSVGWISGRNTVLSALFGLVSVAWFARARSQDDTRAGFAAQLAFAAALASGENGIATLAWLAAYALTLDTRVAWRRALSLAPYLVLTLLWRLYYVRAGYGAVASGFHRELTDAPLRFAAQYALLLPIYLASQLTFPFANLAALFTWSLLPTLALAAAVLALLWRPLTRLLRHDTRARFFALGAAGSVVPLAATVPQDRLTLFVGFGALGLVAHLLLTAAPSERASLTIRWLWRLHTIWGPGLFLALSFGCTSALLGGSARALDQAAAASRGRAVVVVSGPSPLSPHFVSLKRARSGVPCPHFRMLYAGGEPVTVRRSDARSLELQAAHGWLATSLGSVGRDLERAPFAAGQVIELPDVHIEVLTVTERGAPQRVRFGFTHGLEPAAAQLLVWRDREYVGWHAPAIGASETLPAALPF
jgi:hypothetical protein